MKNMLFEKILRHRLFAKSFFGSISLRALLIDFQTCKLMWTQYENQKQLNLIQKKKVLKIIRQASDILFWRDRFLKAGVNIKNPDWEDFLSIPVIAKVDMKKQSSESLVNQSYMADALSFTTSGSTGEPFLFFTDPYYWFFGAPFAWRFFRETGGSYITPIIYVRARDPDKYRRNSEHWFRISSYDDVKNRMEELVRMSERFSEAPLFFSTPSFMLEIAKNMKERGLKIHAKALIVAGEAIHSEQKNFIESAFGAPLYNCYATSELGWLAWECGSRNLHINSEWAYVEILDNSGKQVPSGEEGRIIVTLFYNRIMPFIRYDTGDIGRLMHNTWCRCGKMLPIIQIDGRRYEVIKLANGKEIPFIEVQGIFSKFYKDIKQYQVIQENLNSVMVKIILEKSASSECIKELEKALIKIFKSACSITFSVVDAIEDAHGKTRAYKSMVPQ